ncbi:MAG: hypothetical protein PHQ40_09525 [Anaerolineaceae bacterium]|nr:hypothetical protein [Anaerolineaceae bacterium]
MPDLSVSPFAGASREHWPVWARFLQRNGLANLAADLSEIAGPLAILGAQALYLGQPLFGRKAAGESLQALAQLLEDPTELTQFARFLREAGYR